MMLWRAHAMMLRRAQEMVLHQGVVLKIGMIPQGHDTVATPSDVAPAVPRDDASSRGRIGDRYLYAEVTYCVDALLESLSQVVSCLHCAYLLTRIAQQVAARRTF